LELRRECAVRHADDAHSSTPGHRDHRLDLVRVHVEPGHQEHVLLAIAILTDAFLVHHADVSGGEEPVGAEHLGVRPGLFHSPSHLGAAHPDLAGEPSWIPSVV